MTKVAGSSLHERQKQAIDYERLCGVFADASCLPAEATPGHSSEPHDVSTCTGIPFPQLHDELRSTQLCRWRWLHGVTAVARQVWKRSTRVPEWN